MGKNMQLVDEIFKSLKEYHRLETLKNLNSRAERFEKIQEIVAGVNVFKAEIQDLTLDEQSYLSCKIQQNGVDMGLYPSFLIFYSNKNAKFHKLCKKDNTCVYCGGNPGKCSKPE
jgi:hypothetical protein